MPGVFGAVIFGDFQNDGHLDFFANTSTPNQSALFVGNGTGGFFKTTTINIVSEKLEKGDLDGDSDLDIVSLLSSTASVLKNQNGQFVNTQSLSLVDFSANVSIEDIDNDGDLDIYGFNVFQSDVFLFKNNNGQFSSPEIMPTSNQGGCRGAVFFDIDGDTDKDLMFFSERERLVTKINDNNQYFVNSIVGARFTFPRSPLAIDYDGDGDLDLIAVAPGEIDTYTNFNGTFKSGMQAPFGNVTGTYGNLADITGDGLPEAIAITNTPTTLGSFSNAGDGFLFGLTLFPISPTLRIPPGDIINAKDFNGDQFTDLVFATDNGIELFLNNGTGNFSNSEVLAIGLNPLSTDIDLDGDFDIIFTFAQSRKILTNDGLGNFTETSISAVGDEFAIGDVTGDGFPDIISETPFSTLELEINDGLGNFSPGTPISLNNGFVQMIVIADINGDEISDIITNSRIVMSLGDGNFAPAVNANFQGEQNLFNPIDIDNDSDIDLVGGSRIFLNDSTGHFPSSFAFNIIGTRGYPGDVNGDGLLDVLLINFELTFFLQTP